jgi:GT2 family glycosyltransferase
MITVGVVVPTVAGREQSVERALDALSGTLPEGSELNVTVPFGYATCGEAWNDGRNDVNGDYLYFMADDIVLHPGWLEACVETADAGYIPAARQLHSNGTLEGCGSMGFGRFLPEAPDWTPVRQTGLIFMRTEWWGVVGPFLPIHYAVDDDWTWRALLRGIPCAFREGYTFTHYADTVGTQGVRDKAGEHVQAFVENAARQQFTSEYAHD